MAKGKVSPRQKMINLMYLIFIAMMAMQVDREVLRSFEDVNKSFEQSIALTEENNSTFYKNMEMKAEDDPDYAGTVAKAQSLKSDVDDFVNYIEGLKEQLRPEEEVPADPNEEVETNYNALQSTEAIVQLFFKEEGKGNVVEGNSEAQNFVKRIQDIKAKLKNAGVDDRRLNSVFDTETMSKRQSKSWVSDKFYEQPMIAALTNLTKIQADARTEEGNAIRQMLSSKLEEKIEFTTTTLLVDVPDVIKEGTQKEAFLAIGAYNDEVGGTITLNGKDYPLNAGKATIPLSSAKGNHTFAGKVKYKLPNGTEKEEEFSHSYSVVSETLETAPSGGSISADKMNVVYRGVTNPITATINGADGPISMSASTGSLSGSNGSYNYVVSGGNSVTFTASAKTSSGKTVTERKEFRIKPIPAPQGQIRGKNALTVAKSSLSRLQVEASIPDFEFPVSFTVTSFKVKVPGQKTVSVSGNNLSGVGRILDQVQAGAAVNIFDIEATASGLGNTRIPNIAPVVIDVQ
ncbi:gliding motility protein GldM [Weeksellaceae bacterium KMM 9713]|uniref:Gliding motility protein GldM n=1 Tax=Profundicola chukchiensis TaxID=2961959 RepID=A0A9X4MY06_9FLAO|nr:gliding motility protein GldM [Profundicola chukchiensis]MDG4946956.1 gliding motility protein GldM [Profundicola chukchiensis]